jgi:uncharacterized protein (DUF1800 family)
MGARPGEIVAASGDPRGWLKAQVRRNAAMSSADGLISTRDVLDRRRELYGQPGKMAEDRRRDVRQALQEEARKGLAQEAEARVRHAAATPDGFAERWARFWSNHFTVAARNAQMIGLAGPFEREAIRPHAFGSFHELLSHASLHPAMLVYLDAHRSIGPNSTAGKRREAGLNENLAREILELHTMGVGSGYSQADIIEFAKALTGWTLAAAAGAPSETPEGAMFLARAHEPGARTVLKRNYAEAGPDQAKAILGDLAKEPATARHIAAKLARHFVSDEPAEADVSQLERAFLETQGDLAAMARAVVDLDAAWRTPGAKFKTPDELLVSVARAAAGETSSAREQRGLYQALAQPPFRAPSPAGWPDVAAAWAGPDALKKRLEWANAFARRMARGQAPMEFMDVALGELASQRTREAIDRAESAEQGFTLALMSPEFQRR